MPRPNRPRSITSEQSLARRIRYELGKRDMKPATLARRMTELGCPINNSAIYRILSDDDSQPPRRISVDELVALSSVFEVSLEDLLLPPELAEESDLVLLVRAWAASNIEARAASTRDLEAWSEVIAYVSERPHLQDAMVPLLEQWARDLHPDNPSKAQWMVGRLMHQVTGEERWLEHSSDAYPFRED